jgi:hypothetical protein
MDATEARQIADSLIAGESSTQVKMWGDDNRPDAANNELVFAAMSSTMLTILQGAPGYTAEHEPKAVQVARDAFYPANWSGFRDYGDTYNLVVAAAFLQNEIARRVFVGDDYSRKPRAPEQVYNAETGLPAVSSAEARGEA